MYIYTAVYFYILLLPTWPAAEIWLNSSRHFRISMFQWWIDSNSDSSKCFCSDVIKVKRAFIHSRFHAVKWDIQMSFTLNTGLVAQDCCLSVAGHRIQTLRYFFPARDDWKQRVLLQSATGKWEGHCFQVQLQLGNMSTMVLCMEVSDDKNTRLDGK